jgi:hypothetical protein
MLYVRQIFPPETSPLWGRLDNVIEERAAETPRTGSSVWDSIEQRAEQARAQDEEQ